MMESEQVVFASILMWVILLHVLLCLSSGGFVFMPLYGGWGSKEGAFEGNLGLSRFEPGHLQVSYLWLSNSY
ncbi:hypothetical protein VNO77_00386 [Canavalia gladiata]|uniref:Uncharacterized protein n=1 Tax=Canavalia gladiata TaxID=3824 RepID=A0AAN9R996_CANGL